MTNAEIKKMVVEELKLNGLEVAEETAMISLKILIGLVKKVIEATPTPYDNMLLPVIALAEPKLIELIDEINKEDNE